MSSGCLRAAPIGEVNTERGIIEGVSVCTVGEAKGHGVHLDSEFIAEVERQGNASKQGLKARFGHPNMCSTALGTFLGRFKNFSVDGDQVRADLFLSNSAKDTPHGDLHSYVTSMAKDEPDMFGTSIVFTPGRTYVTTEDGAKEYDFESDTDAPVYVECDTLHACDAVDEPAANDGLFSRFSGETLAGQMTEFLDLNPQVWQTLSDNPSILETLVGYGSQIDEFVERYREYRDAQEGGQDMTDETIRSDEMDEVVEEPCATETPEDEMETAEPVEEMTEEVVDEPETEVEPELPVEEPEAEEAQEDEPEVEEEAEEEMAEGMTREEFASIADRFGDTIAAQVMREGGDYYTALELENETLKAENETLRASTVSGRPAAVVVAKPKAQIFKTGK
jgi:hypothetical protein